MVLGGTVPHPIFGDMSRFGISSPGEFLVTNTRTVTRRKMQRKYAELGHGRIFA